MTVETPAAVQGFTDVDAPDPSIIASCVHCGLCLNECPTYRVVRQEMDSPRGRIQLMKGVAEGHIALTSDAFLTHTFRCLECRACETACPSGVQYGPLIESVRSQTTQAGLLPTRRRVADLVLRHVFTRPRALRWAGYGLRLYARSGLQWLMRRSGLLRLAAPGLAEVERLSPPVSGRFLQASDLRFVPAEGPTRYRVGFITGCLMALSFADVHRASLRVLARNGCEVHIPEHQVCCGALHVHGGAREAGRQLARRNIEAFEAGGYDAIVINSAGCGSALKEYPELLAGDHKYHARAEDFASRVKDFSEFLAELDLDRDFGSIDERVVYQDACHLMHGQGISSQPRELLAAVPGVELTELERPTVCCGSAGLYSATDTGLSLQILDEKLDEIEGSGANTLVSTNPGCLLHIAYGARARGLDLRVVHIAEFLDEAYSARRG